MRSRPSLRVTVRKVSLAGGAHPESRFAMRFRVQCLASSDERAVRGRLLLFIAIRGRPTGFRFNDIRYPGKPLLMDCYGRSAVISGVVRAGACAPCGVAAHSSRRSGISRSDAAALVIIESCDSH